MFLLPAAERYRRVLYYFLACLTLSTLALVRPAWLERLADWAVAPLAAGLAPLAGQAAELLAAGGPVEAASPPAPGAGLTAVERRLGMPPPGPGRVWLEVPVEEFHRTAATARLAAGREFGLAESLPVAFGRHWLGRISAVGESWAELALWTGAEVPTGLWLGPPEAGAGMAVCLGRGGSQPPVVRHLDHGAHPAAGMIAYWRPQAQDAARDLDGVLEVGRLFQEGDARRGDSTWQIESRLPRGAEGRVFVALAARTERLVAEPSLTACRAGWVLRADGVFGTRFAAVQAEEHIPGVVLQAGRVVGPVAAELGGLMWVRRSSPEDWGDEALAVAPGSERIRLASALSAAERDGVQLFTRGGRGVPRGLWLGPGGAAAPPVLAAVPLEVVARAGDAAGTEAAP